MTALQMTGNIRGTFQKRCYGFVSSELLTPTAVFAFHKACSHFHYLPIPKLNSIVVTHLLSVFENICKGKDRTGGELKMEPELHL